MKFSSLLLMFVLLSIPVFALTVDELVASYDFSFSDGSLNITSFSPILVDSDSDSLNDTLVFNFTTNASSSVAYYFTVSLEEDNGLLQKTENVTVSSGSPVASVSFLTREITQGIYNYSLEVRNQSYALIYSKFNLSTDSLSNYDQGIVVDSISDQNVGDDLIRLTIDFNTTYNTTKNVTVYLGYGDKTISAEKEVSFTTPTEEVTIDVDNETIKSTHHDGTYNISTIVVGDKILSVSHTTSSYDYEDFAKTSYVQSISSATSDADADNLSDKLTFTLTVIAKTSGNHVFSGSVFDEDDTLIATFNQTESLSIGTNYVAIDINGSDLYSSYFYGNLSLSVLTLSAGGDSVDALLNAHTTAEYSYAEFERPPQPDVTLSMVGEYDSGTTNIAVNVTNQGAVPAYNVIIDIFDNNSYENQSVLAALGVTETRSFSYIVPNTTNNTMFVAIVDFDNFIDESNETNNYVQYPPYEENGTNETGHETGNFSSLTISLVTPSSNNDETQNEFFDFTTQVCCEDADCGDIDVSLDPKTDEYNYFKEKHCVGSECTTSFYSYPRFGFEDGQWKPIDQLISFKGTIPIECHVESDGEHLVECLDYNSTNMTLRISLAPGAFLTNVPVRVLGASDKELGRQNAFFLTPWNTVTVTVPAGLTKNIHVGAQSTIISYLPNESGMDGWWEVTDSTLGLYGWSDCDAMQFNAGQKSDIAVNTTDDSIYAFGGGSATDYSLCYRLRWNITDEPDNITSIWSYQRLTGTLNPSGADSITKALYLGDVAGLSWTPLHIYENAWSEVELAGAQTTSISDYINDTGSDKYVYTLLHMNASKPSSSYAYANLYYAELRITTEETASNSSTKDGLVSTTPGSTPFYTTNSNPQTINLNQSQCQNVTWSVNATGDLNTTHTFFAYANISSNQSINDQTNTINITIVNSTSGSGWSVTDTDDFASSAEGWTGGSRDATAGTYNSTGDWGTLRKNYTLSTSANVVNLTINDFWYAEDSNDPKIFVPGSTASDNDYLLFSGTKPNINWKHIDDGGGYGECNQDIIGTVSWTDGDSVTILVNYTSGQWCTYRNGQKCRCETSTLVHGDNFEVDSGNAHVIAVDDVVYSEFQS